MKMKFQTRVVYSTLAGDRTLCIPISYQPEKSGFNTIHHVEVLLSDDERPEWLAGTKYSARERYTPNDGFSVGVTHVDYNQQPFSTADEAAFAVAAIDSVRFLIQLPCWN